MKLLAAGVLAFLLAGMAGYGWWYFHTRAARAFDRAAVLVVISDHGSGCRVMRAGSVIKEGLLCTEVPPYLSDQLKLVKGTAIAVSFGGKANPAVTSQLNAELARRGYKSAGVVRIGFITEPDNER
jgi:hypothetical protein